VRTPLLVGVLAVMGTTIYPCSDRLDKIAPTESPSPSQAASHAVTGELQEGGCAASAPDSNGRERAMVIPRRLLPFKVRPLSRNTRSGRDDGRDLTPEVEPRILTNRWGEKLR
jgi:hypothetical protein